MKKNKVVHCALVGCFATACGADASIVFLDTEIQFTQNWEVVDSGTHPTQASTSPIHFPAGGNPDGFGSILNSGSRRFGNTGATVAWYFNTDSAYSPSDSGQILDLAYSEDYVVLGGPGQGAGVALRQDGNLYAAINHRFVTSGSEWQPIEQTGLVAEDFSLYFEDPRTGSFRFLNTAHPDFSSSGEEIEFGFMRSNAGGNVVAYSADSGIDNWQLVVNNVPEPGSLGLLACAGVSMMLRRRRG